MIDELKETMSRHPAFQGLLSACGGLEAGGIAAVTGIAGSLNAILIACLHEELSRQILAVTSDKVSADRLRDDLAASAGAGRVQIFGGRGHQPGVSPENVERVADIASLRSLQVDPATVVVTHAAGLTALLPRPDSSTGKTFTLTSGAAASLGNTAAHLQALGFQRKELVEAQGDYAIRGGILDIYPFLGENPVRVEFLGESIESLREFDPLSQRSLKELDAAVIVSDLLEPGSGDQQGSASLIEYLRPDALLVLEDPAIILSTVDSESRERGGMGRDDLAALFAQFPRVDVLSLSGGNPSVIDFGSQPQPAFNGSVGMLRRTLSEWQRQHYAIHIGCDTQSELVRLKELLEMHDQTGEQAEELSAAGAIDAPELRFSLEALHAGFVLPSSSVVVIAEHQIFNRLKRHGRRRTQRFRGFSARELEKLRRGDYVVHQEYGIGRFDGLKKIRVRNAEQEVVSILYAENDRLYVNLNYLQKLQKYSSKEGHIPKLTRLGSAEWDRLRNRAKKRVKEIARDLITLYARRKQLPGHAFQKDAPWQKELEASFMYEDTYDQAKATLDVKEDMEAAHPMDRLICGDVGFGKTEVAVRASFKAVLDGRQVAVLVPTTILAMQHHTTFRERMSRYGLGIEVLSRFKSTKEQKEILSKLSAGSVDIVIGTHRLLSKDVRFRDLGLLIIDEEHRFGVAAKEKLRELRAEVDTLSLTATPIPRTLHFSLMGARDLSIIATPPRNRLPVITETTQWDDRLIHDAVMREIHREGQAYFVHDRVQKIEEITGRLRAVLPNVGVQYVHGQMHPRAVEQVMMDFLEKRFGLLVCTKIIESGLDIPNVNTIIINRADRFGMAELYQLRGRVGRSNVQAYAYLLVPPIESLPRTTLQRLQAIEEFTELGSGLNLSMRDLEIRGAGNLLGSEQSGFIESMGFETYTRILDEAIRELKEEEFKDLPGVQRPAAREAPEASVEADIDAFIPESYVSDDTERLSIYRRIYGLATAEQLEEIREELKDRFGGLPPEAANLFGLVRLRLAAAGKGLSKITLNGRSIEVDFPPEQDTAFYEGETFRSIMENISGLRQKGVQLKQSGSILKITADLEVSPDDTIETAMKFLEKMADSKRSGPPTSAGSG